MNTIPYQAPPQFGAAPLTDNQPPVGEATNGKKAQRSSSLLINRAHVKTFLLEQARLHRPFHKFERVSGATLGLIEGLLKRECVRVVKALPSKGKTI